MCPSRGCVDRACAVCSCVCVVPVCSATLQVFRYLGISKNMNALWLTLFRASHDLVAFGLGFLVIVLGFALMTNFFFGSALSDFHNVSSSFSTLMRYPLGDFNYGELSQVRCNTKG